MARLCIVNYCPQKLGLIERGPFMYHQLLSSESGPQCACPLNMFKWSLTYSLPHFLLPTKNHPTKNMSSKTGPHCAWTFYVLSITILRKWASMWAALKYVWIITLYYPLPPRTLPPHNSLQTKNLVSVESRPQSTRTFNGTKKIAWKACQPSLHPSTPPLPLYETKMDHN